jgi:putative PEP-CTERM system TPR-repeat lipoprotein
MTPHRTLAALAVAAALAACSQNDPAKYMTSAEAYIAKHNYSAAAIELKNALVAAPDNARARYLLGVALLEGGDPVGAATELRKAAAQGSPADEVYPLLARAVTEQRVTKQDLAELEKAPVTNAHARATVLARTGYGYLSLFEPAEAKARIDEALAAEPDNSDARIAQARWLAASRDLPRAGETVDRVLAAQPDNVDALSVKSEVQLASGDSPGARRTLEHLVSIAPRALRSRYLLASLYVQVNETDKAASEVEVLVKNAPNDPHTLHAVAMVAFARGDMKTALDSVQKSLDLAPDYLPARYLAGLIDLKRGAYATAEQSLRTVAAQSPNDDGVAFALSQLLVRRGQLDEARDTLAPLLRRSPDNTQALRLAAEIEVARKSPAKAADYIARANAIESNNIDGKVRLAEVRLAKGDTAQGMHDLEALSATQGNAREPDIALVAAYMRSRDYPKALKAADTMIAKDPSSPIGYNTKGAVYMGMGDLVNARAQLDKALAKNPAFLAAVFGLAQIDTAERKFDSAKANYQKVLDTLPNSEPALMGMVDLLRNTGAKPEEVAAALSRAISANPQSPVPRIVLINYYAQQKNWRQALSTAQAAQAAIPDTPAILDVLAAVQTGAGEGNSAVETYLRMSKLNPQNPMPLMRLAAIESSRKNYGAAIDYLKTARAMVPDSPTIVIALGAAYHDAGKSDAGLAEARRVQKEDPKRAGGYALEAEIQALDHKNAEAIAAYGAALAHEPPALIVVRQYDLLNKLARSADAQALVKQWFAQHPQDVIVRTVLGQRALESGDCAAAVRYLRDAVANDPNNASLLNNFAWCLSETNDPSALDYAERAYRIAPGNAAIANTYGWVLVQRGDSARGIESLRRAVALDPAEPARRIYLAKALIKTGDKAGARKELETVAGTSGNSQAEAQQLLSKL